MRPTPRSEALLLDEVDWSATPLGPREGWSAALRNAADLAVGSRFPITLFWGPEFVLVYNEAYARLIADKHPSALGRPAREVFPEAWDAIGPMMQRVLAGHGATWVEDEPLPLWRNGRLEECYFTFSYSPVRADDGTIEGVMDIATETTREVQDRRRLALLAAMNAALSDVERAEDVPEQALRILRTATADMHSVEIRLGDALDAGEGDARGTIALPLASRSTPGAAALVVRPNERVVPDAAYRAFLWLIAGSLGQALDRVSVREAERGISEALQLGLLAAPPAVPGFDIAVRYRPAAQEAQIGGDWHDAFMLPNGRLTIVIGDVTGHDAGAAAAMAQVRNLLRGVAYSVLEPPARVLAGLDEAMQGLQLDVFATAVLGQVERRTLQWCNAGHLPPVHVAPDGRARLLERSPDTLLGLGGARHDHGIALAPGAAVVLFTDGLVERRGVALTESLAWLARVLDGCRDMTAEQLADHVLGTLDGPVEDDVALLVLRAEA